ncbi:hypothetical protein ColLi_13119 [Colletotrichum liriopes]|uniref:Ubiquitin-like protease family profile domain-containing protein n=1 Tax=Colletotrichum liriopes TaxID=708192 RepID=A0AA37M080_9PEZI|nr:hypothetical protein ColLi_13119 [Colletotrichum liriopes]
MPRSTASGLASADGQAFVKDVICAVVEHPSLNVGSLTDSVATTLSPCPKNDRNNVIRNVALQQPKIHMAVKMMVKNLSSADRMAVQTQLKTQGNALKRSKLKNEYIKELDSLWGSRDAWLPPMYRSKRHEVPGFNILVSLRSISHKAEKLGIRLLSLWEDGGDLLEASRPKSGTQQPILTARSAEAANRDFHRRHTLPEPNETTNSDDEDADKEDPPVELGRVETAEKDYPSSPRSLSESGNNADGFANMGDFGHFGDLASDDNSDLGAELQFSMADVSIDSLSTTHKSAAPVPDATSDISVVVENDAEPLVAPFKVTTAIPDVVIVDDTGAESATGPPRVHPPSTSVALFLRIQEQLSNNVSLYDDVLWYTLWSAMPSSRELANRKIVLVDPLLLSIDAWQAGGTPLKLPEILCGKLALYTIYAPIHHRHSEHWTAVQAVVGASQVIVNHFDSSFSAQRSHCVKRLFDSLFSKACPGSEIEFVEAACPQQPDSVSCGIYTIDTIRRLVHGKCIPRHIDQEGERKSLLAMLPDQQALRATFERERGARLHSVEGRLSFNPTSSVSSNSQAPDPLAAQDGIAFSDLGKKLRTIAQRSTMVGLGFACTAPNDNTRRSAVFPDTTLDLVAHTSKRKRSPSPSQEEEERPSKHMALADWARALNKQVNGFARSDNVLEETAHRLVRTRLEETALEERLSAANARVRQATTALEESNEQVAAADFLEAVQEAARVSASRIERRAGGASQSKVLETINEGTVILTASLRGTGAGVATANEVHEGLARAEEALQAAITSATEETKALEATAARKREDEALLREQEGLKLVREGLAKIQSLLE